MRKTLPLFDCVTRKTVRSVNFLCERPKDLIWPRIELWIRNRVHPPSFHVFWSRTRVAMKNSRRSLYVIYCSARGTHYNAQKENLCKKCPVTEKKPVMEPSNLFAVLPSQGLILIGTVSRAARALSFAKYHN